MQTCPVKLTVHGAYVYSCSAKYRHPVKDFANVIRAIIGMMFHNGL